jgi:hypothetical protein
VAAVGVKTTAKLKVELPATVAGRVMPETANAALLLVIEEMVATSVLEFVSVTVWLEPVFSVTLP